MEDNLSLQPGNQPRLELVIAQSNSSVTGMVRSEEGLAEASAFVVVVDAGLGGAYRSMSTMFTGNDGSFSFAPLAPAEYRVFAFDKEIDTWREMELLEEFKEKSKVIRVEANKRALVELTLIKLLQE